jgi:hypothetical protein
MILLLFLAFILLEKSLSLYRWLLNHKDRKEKAQRTQSFGY